MLNVILLEGRIASDITSRTTSTGIQTCNFSLANESERKGADGKREVTFFSCSFYGVKATTVCKYFKRGDPIIVKGTARLLRYKDRNGNDQAKIWISDCDFCFPLTTRAKNDGSAAGNGGYAQTSGDQQSASGTQTDANAVFDDSELPF